MHSVSPRITGVGNVIEEFVTVAATNAYANDLGGG